MLKTRLITAFFLLAGCLPALFYLPQLGWGVLAAGVAGLAAWEWGGFLRASAPARLGFGLAMTAVCLAVLLGFPALFNVGDAGFNPAPLLPAYLLAGAFWVLLVPLWMRQRWQIEVGFPGYLAGCVVIFPTWLALVQLRGEDLRLLLFALVLVWIADVAAYFSGRRFGRRKLAPSISPGKTWEGAVGATLVVLLIGGAVIQAQQLSWLWLLVLPVWTAVSIVGDLFESLLKRQAGIKDSSQILPGHGGILDRIDSQTSTLPLVALIWLLIRSGT
ncbi:MAG: hypothetical protein RIR00_394 [Pseudomonadota bacterium]